MSFYQRLIQSNGIILFCLVISILNTSKLEAQFDDPFTVQALFETNPSLPEGALGYVEDGSFSISISDGTDCTGLFDIVATPDIGSSPLGNTPQFTTPNVIFNATDAGSPYLFTGAGAGTYTIQVFELGLCDHETNPEVITVTVPDGDYDEPFIVQAMNETSPTLPEEAPGYVQNGSFSISISDGTDCTGLFDIVATPVVGSSPLGNTPQFTSPNVIFNATEAGSPYVFTGAGAGTYTIQVFELGLCDHETNPEVITVTVPDGDYDDPFIVQAMNETSPTLPEEAPGYVQNGSFSISISDGTDCTGLFDIVATPVVGSSPLGNTPQFTSPNVIFNATEAGSPYVFTGAGAGRYTIQVFELGLCDHETNPEVITVTVTDGDYDEPFIIMAGNIISPTISESNSGYTPDGSFQISISEGPSCTGTTYNIEAIPIPGSSPIGNNPASPFPSFIIGATAAGSPYLFTGAGAGDYTIEVTETGPCTQEINPDRIVITVPNIVPIPTLSQWGLLILTLLMIIIGVTEFKKAPTKLERIN